MISVYRADQLKKFTPFSYLHHSFILSLNVKVYVRFTVISSDFAFFFICQELCWMRGLCISFTFTCFCFQSEEGGGGGRVKSLRTGGGEGKGVKKFRTWRVTDLRGYFCWGGQYPVTCHVYYHLFIIAITCIIICY